MISDDTVEPAELVSALADDQLQGDALAQALDLLAQVPDARQQWLDIHLVRDLLSNPACKVDVQREAAFMLRLREQLDQDAPHGHCMPVSSSQVAAASPRTPQRLQTFDPGLAANDSTRHWSRWAGLASVGVVALLGWQWVQLSGHSGDSRLLAQTAPPTTVLAQPQAPVMVRDPQLDQLLAAHQRLGGASALQSPAGFLRSATFERSGR